MQGTADEAIDYGRVLTVSDVSETYINMRAESVEVCTKELCNDNQALVELRSLTLIA